MVTGKAQDDLWQAAKEVLNFVGFGSFDDPFGVAGMFLVREDFAKGALAKRV